MQINAMEQSAKVACYRSILPSRCFAHLHEVDPTRFSLEGSEDEAFGVVAEANTGTAHLRVPAHRVNRDFCISLDLDEAGAGQLRIGFVVINNLIRPRFDIDVDENGQVTMLGTAGRNIEQELAAMADGLGPCQVRHGLGLMAAMLPRLEEFATRAGYVAICLEPLTYHNALMYERYGFSYMTGRKRMVAIDAAFAPGGVLHEAMDGSSPFRMPEMASDPRGRSWAIHDGILDKLDGDRRLDSQMVKVIGHHADIDTFTGDQGASEAG